MPTHATYTVPATFPLIDAYARWDADKQDYDLDTTFDKGHHCGECDGECRIKWVDAPDRVAVGSVAVGSVVVLDPNHVEVIAAKRSRTDLATALRLPLLVFRVEQVPDDEGRPAHRIAVAIDGSTAQFSFSVDAIAHVVAPEADPDPEGGDA